MILTAYAQASQPGSLQLWVGMLGTEQPPAPRFVLDRQPLAAEAGAAMWPIRDLQAGPGGQPLNHQGVFRLAVADAGRPHLVRIEAGDARYEFMTSTLPASVPSALEGSFNLLLCSCYYQPEDAGGLLGSIVSQIQLQPQLTLMAGDQVYMDLPLMEDLPEEEPALSRALGDKYLRNWASNALHTPGLQSVLARAPVVCIPDDHEFWNNYPFAQKQLPNTWNDAVRRRWADAALALYQDYQIGGPPAARSAVRIDVDPLRMLFLDMRCRRDERFKQLMDAQALAALATWTEDLIAARRRNEAAVGVLASGQALFIEPPKDEQKKRNVDAEMGNYTQFAVLQEALRQLADAGVPVVYLTGDVHWSRVASGLDLQQDHPQLFEVICSPSRLIRTPLLDTARQAAGQLRGIFGKQGPWPRHSDPEPVPHRFGAQGRFALTSHYARPGDCVAIVSFTRAGNGVDFEVSYYAIHPDKAIAKSESTGPYQLRAH